MKTASLAVTTAALVTGLYPAAADACGGTFCDGGVPGPMPVDQSGENVIFVLGEDEVEVHIQIQIDPDTNAEKFGWLVPLAAVPEFSVGSQPLFTRLLEATVPTYGLQRSFEACDDGASNSGALSGGGPTEGGGGESDGSPTTGVPEPDPLIKEETVGAFQIAVLQAKDIATIKTWLVDNGYLWDEKAAPILQQYLDELNVIVALKLATGEDVADVHPITLRYPSRETCFPLRLTRIAAVEDMDIRVFLLGTDRAAPTNYKHVLVNPLRIDWLNLAVNYKEVVSQAVDAFGADGRAFVTEYAGPSDVVATWGVHSPSWDDTVFLGIDPTLVVSTLNTQGLTACYDPFSCTFEHPLVLPLLEEFLPPPPGLDPLEFYSDLGSYGDQIDAAKWNNGADFAAALLSRVIEPGAHAAELLATWGYVTRMYTTISPLEMTEDPIFHVNPDLDDVTNQRTAQDFVLCNGDSVVTLPDGREIYVPGGTSWPKIPDADWWVEEVQTVAIKGAPMTIVNNTAAINTKLEAWNLAHGWPRTPADSSSSDTDTDSAGHGGGGSGCGCRSEQAPGALGLGLSALALLGLRRRRAAS